MATISNVLSPNGVRIDSESSLSQGLISCVPYGLYRSTLRGPQIIDLASGLGATLQTEGSTSYSWDDDPFVGWGMKMGTATSAYSTYYVQHIIPTALQAMPKGTVSIILRASAAYNAGYNYYMMYGSTSTLRLYVNSADRLVLYLPGWASLQFMFEGYETFASGDVIQLTASWDYAANSANAYLNGTTLGIYSLGTQTSSPEVNVYCTGRSNLTGSYKHLGPYYNVCWWNRNLSPTEIAEINRNPFGMVTDTLDRSIYGSLLGAAYTESPPVSLGIATASAKNAALIKSVSAALAVLPGNTRNAVTQQAVPTILSVATEVDALKTKLLSPSVGLSLSPSVDKQIAFIKSAPTTLTVATGVQKSAAYTESPAGALAIATEVLYNAGRVLAASSGIGIADTHQQGYLFNIYPLLGIDDTINRGIGEKSSATISISTAVNKGLVHYPSINVGLSTALQNAIGIAIGQALSLDDSTNVESTGTYVVSPSAAVTLLTGVSAYVAKSLAASGSLTLGAIADFIEANVCLPTATLNVLTAVTAAAGRFRDVNIGVDVTVSTSSHKTLTLPCPVTISLAASPIAGNVQVRMIGETVTLVASVTKTAVLNRSSTLILHVNAFPYELPHNIYVWRMNRIQGIEIP